MNNYFCVLPFFGAEYKLSQRPTPCCLLPNNANIQKIRTDMLNGVRPQECQKCWDIEAVDKISDRQIKNSAFDFYSDISIENIENNCKEDQFSQQIIKLYTSNLCNSTCVTCIPMASTQWQALKKIPINKQTIHDSYLNSINWKEIKMLSFVGGEPLYEKKNLDILEKLATVNPNCFISIVTNGSVTLTPKQMDLFKKFKNFNISLSIDGVEKQFEYIRYPLKWDTLLYNIEQYKHTGANLSVSFTVSILNILYYNEIIKWFNEQDLSFNTNIVSSPNYFSINVLPPDIKKNIPLINYNYKSNFDIKLFQQFVSEIKMQDKLKNIKISEYLPELHKIMTDYIT